MIGEPQGHRRGATRVTPTVERLGQRAAEGDVRAEPVVREERQAEEGVPGGDVLGERVGRAGEAAQPVAQRPV